MIGDAWLGWYTTKNGGQTWRTRLLPGYPQDVSPQGLASPLKGMEAGADPVVRSGANGMFFYAGIAFVRGEGGGSRLFVARFIDNNDRERPDAESIQYIDTSVIQSAPQGTVSNFFVDKPWIAVDIPRDGARRCRLGGRKSGVERQTVACARVYVAYTVLSGVAPDQIGTIMVAHSEDSGATWSAPQPIRIDPDVNDDGQVTAADAAAVKAGSGQRCQTAAYQAALDVNVDCVVEQPRFGHRFETDRHGVPGHAAQGAPGRGPRDSAVERRGLSGLATIQLSVPHRSRSDHGVPIDRGGATFTPPAVVSPLNPFDQGTSDTRSGPTRSPRWPSTATGAGISPGPHAASCPVRSRSRATLGSSSRRHRMV